MGRLGCNLNYDKLQDLCENHRALRGTLNVGDWDDTSFRWQRIRDTLCLVETSTQKTINELLVIDFSDAQSHEELAKLAPQVQIVAESSPSSPPHGSFVFFQL